MRLAILIDSVGNTYAVPPDKVMIASAHDNRLCEMYGISRDSVVAFVFDTAETPLSLAMTFEEAVQEVEEALNGPILLNPYDFIGTQVSGKCGDSP